MPPAKKSALTRQSAALKTAPKKKSPPPPREKDHGPHGKPHKKHKHDSAKDLRRAFEHLGRVQILGSIPGADPAVPSLLRLAQSLIDAGDAESAADLLRAAEHLSFATLAADSQPGLTPELEEILHHEFHKRAGKAEDHQPAKASILGKLARQALTQAHTALDAGRFHAALEFVRAAEALAEVEADLPEDLVLPTRPTKTRRLR